MAAFCSFSSASVGSRVALEGWGPPIYSSSRQHCRMGISFSKERHSSSRRPLGHVGVQHQNQHHRTESQLSPPHSSSLQPHQELPPGPPFSAHLALLLPGCCPVQPSSPFPASSWAECVHSLHIPQCPSRQASFFLLHYGTGLATLPAFILHITALPLLKTLLWFSPPKPQDKSPRAMAPAGICTWLLPRSNLPSPAATCPFHLSALLSWLSAPHPQLPPFSLSQSRHFKIYPQSPPCFHSHYTLRGLTAGVRQPGQWWTCSVGP